MKLTPLGDRVVVKADAAETQTAGGLFIPSVAASKSMTGTVVGVGPEAEEFSEGDKVLFIKDGGEVLSLGNDEQFTVLHIAEIIGIERKDGLEAVRDNIICVGAEFGDQKTRAGIILKSNIHESQGITARWMQVYKVGPEVDFISVDEWALVQYGRWTEGFMVDGIDKSYRVDPKGCLAAAPEKPDTVYYNSDVVMTEKKIL